jgi:hypothetical protein
MRQLKEKILPILGVAVENESRMTNPQAPIEAPSPARLSTDGWAAIAAAVFILLIVLGTLPRIPW